MPRGVSAESKARRLRALELRARGWSYIEIAKDMGCSPSAARHHVERAYLKGIREPAEIVQRMEVDRLDIMLRKALEIMDTVHVYVQNGRIVRERVLDDMGDPIVIGINEDGSAIYETRPVIDHKPALDAIQTALRIMERRAKLLGLDAPTKVEVWTIDALDAKIRELCAELGEDPGQWITTPTAENTTAERETTT